MGLGTTGLKVSRICLGMMSYGDPGWRDWVLGEETADMYSLGASEEVTGRLLSKYFAKRDDYVLATKVYSPVGDGPDGTRRGSRSWGKRCARTATTTPVLCCSTRTRASCGAG